jgi:N-acetylglucosaminyldiphosphoundecaprenol N-acetyl-beta-D-mannosaminyltransferase
VKIKKLINGLLGGLPLLLFAGMLLGLLVIRLLYGTVLPVWGAWGLGIAWCVMAFDYLVRAELFKQIGGFAVALIAVMILTGALIPKETVARYPHIASDELVQKIESAWNAVYTGDVIKNYSPKQQLIDYGTSLASFDPFRTGKMILFGLLGFALAVVYLFPLEPFRGKRRVNACLLSVDKDFQTTRQPDNPTASPTQTTQQLRTARPGAKTVYAARFALLFVAGSVFAVHVELLQVLSPTRVVSEVSILDSCMGLLIGLLCFVPVHLFYVFLAEHRARGSSRFNILGVGVDAVCMDDCLKLFESLIETVKTEQGSSLKPLNGEVENGDWNGALGGGSTSSEPSERFNALNDFNESAARPVMTSALGVAGIIEARRNPKMQRILNESVLNTPDGMPLVWLGKLFGYRNIERVYGPDLLRDVCAYSASKGWKHFFYGAAPGIVEKLKQKLEEKHPQIQIAGIYCPPFRDLTPEEEAAVAEQVNRSETDIFWIGISTPRQLYFMDHIRPKLKCKIICPVGYAFDVNAGVQEDAPEWAKHSGFQWLHRAIKQPRLWKRYLPDNPRFVFEVALQILHLKRYPMLTDERQVKRWRLRPVGSRK